MNPYKKFWQKKNNSSWKVKAKRREKGKENTCAQAGRSLPGFSMGCCCAPTYAFFIHPITWQQLVTWRPGQDALLKVKPGIRTRWCTKSLLKCCVFFFLHIFTKTSELSCTLLSVWGSRAGKRCRQRVSIASVASASAWYYKETRKKKKQLFTENETKYSSDPNDCSWYMAQPAVLLSWSCYHSNHCSCPFFLFLYWTGSRKLTRDLLRAWWAGRHLA